MIVTINGTVIMELDLKIPDGLTPHSKLWKEAVREAYIQGCEPHEVQSIDMVDGEDF